MTGVAELSPRQERELTEGIESLGADIVQSEAIAPLVEKIGRWLDEGFLGKEGFQFFRYKGLVFDRRLQRV